MDKNLLKKTIIWGVALWLFGYVLGFIFFAFVPLELIGWYITPLGIAATLWVLLKIIKTKKIKDYVLIGINWLVIAVILDYFFLVKLLNPADGYYKLDVYVYYGLTLLLPVVIGFYKNSKSE